MSGKWRLYGFKGDLISDAFSTLAQATAALERRVGRTLARRYGGSGGVWSFYVEGHRYWVLEDSAPGFPIGSGLEHRNAKACSQCFLVHPTGDCPW